MKILVTRSGANHGKRHVPSWFGVANATLKSRDIRLVQLLKSSKGVALQAVLELPRLYSLYKVTPWMDSEQELSRYTYNELPNLFKEEK